MVHEWLAEKFAVRFWRIWLVTGSRSSISTWYVRSTGIWDIVFLNNHDTCCHLHKSGRVLAQRQILWAPQRSPPFYQKLRQHSGFVETVCLSMKKTMKCQCLSLCIKRLWSTSSKALEKSKINEPAILFSLISLNQSSVILIHTVWQEWCSLTHGNYFWNRTMPLSEDLHVVPI